MTLKIGRFFGINLYIHWTFWLLPLWALWSGVSDPHGTPPLVQLSLLSVLFGCVVLHEYGHALTARRFGIATRDVTLYPIGGVARLERMSERPLEEIAIAVAGPLVNLLIAVSLAVGLFGITQQVPGFTASASGEFLVYVLLMNVILFGFNLLPAFPMDGGRVFRALLSIPMGRLQATRVAVALSTVLAVVGGTTAALLLGDPWMLFIALFITGAAWQELAALQVRPQQRQTLPEAPMAESVAEPEGWQNFLRPAVTVYLWDARKHEWVAQGVTRPNTVSSHPPTAV